MITVTPRSGRVYYSLALTEHRKQQTPKNPCEDELTYSFTACVKESLSDSVGCRLPWDSLSDQTRPKCTDLQQFRTFTTDLEFFQFATMRQIFTKTGCLKPCRYWEYVVLEGPIESSRSVFSYYAAELWMTTTDITVLTEIPVYPWTSLLAEFGGTFSLFFGLSMMTLWDGMRKMAGLMKQYMSVSRI